MDDLPVVVELASSACEMSKSKEEGEASEGEDANYSFATSDKQEARAFLRERFLRVITGIVGKRANFYLYENTNVVAEFRGCDIDFLEIFVRNLETPLGKIPEAILRSTDVIHFRVEGIESK